MKALAILMGILFFNSAQAGEVLKLQKMEGVKFAGEVCSEEIRQCAADVVSLTTGKVVAKKIKTSIYLYNVINAYRSSGTGGDIFVKDGLVLAAAKAEYQEQIVFDDYTTLTEAKFFVLGPSSQNNTLNRAEAILTIEDGTIDYSISYNHTGDEKTHQYCNEDPVDCFEYVDHSFSATQKLRINPLLGLKWPAGDAQFYAIAGKAVEAVLDSNGILTVAK